MSGDGIANERMHVNRILAKILAKTLHGGIVCLRAEVSRRLTGNHPQMYLQVVLIFVACANLSTSLDQSYEETDQNYEY